MIITALQLTGAVGGVCGTQCPLGRAEGSNEPVRAGSVSEALIKYRQTYPDLHATVEHQIAEGDWVISRITAPGTHLGTWSGMKPTGKRVEITGVNVDRVVDGRIVEHGGAANLLGPLSEIGAIRVVGDS